MKIVAVKDIDDCRDGSQIKDLLFDRETSEAFIRFLARLGKLQYIPDFARPYYKISQPRCFSLKGVRGCRTARIVIYRDAPRHIRDIKACVRAFTEPGVRMVSES